jgi:hypothetical protein
MNTSQSIQMSFSKSLTAIKTRKGVVYVLIFILALIAFEAFNFSTTDFALSDMLGDLRFGGIRWATLLSIAFCGIDFAGIARLFAPQTAKEDPQKMWIMFGAWILTATMNAILTWWGVVLAMQTHTVMSVAVVNPSFVTRVVPIFIALMVWVIRILLVGTLSRKSGKLMQEAKTPAGGMQSRREFRQAQSRAAQAALSAKPASASARPASPSRPNSYQQGFRPDPKYIPMQEEAVYHSFKSTGKATGSLQRRL